MHVCKSYFGLQFLPLQSSHLAFRLPHAQLQSPWSQTRMGPTYTCTTMLFLLECKYVLIVFQGSWCTNQQDWINVEALNATTSIANYIAQLNENLVVM